MIEVHPYSNRLWRVQSLTKRRNSQYEVEDDDNFDAVADEILTMGHSEVRNSNAYDTRLVIDYSLNLPQESVDPQGRLQSRPQQSQRQRRQSKPLLLLRKSMM
jgi:hypothetical protein